MPFRVASVMDQKPVFVEFAAAEGPNVGELCRRFGISSTTGYKLLERYGNGGQNQIGLVRERFFTPRLRSKR